MATHEPGDHTPGSSEMVPMNIARANRTVD